MITHGHAMHGKHSPTYNSWAAMKARCGNPNNSKYYLYGARGISVCERWMDFNNFLEDMGDRPKDMTLDRIDNYGNYYPDNCRWATPSQQQNNLRHTTFITLMGREKPLSEWAKELNAPKGTILSRIKMGWSEEQILNTPVKHGNRLRKAKCATLTAHGETLSYSEWYAKTGIKPNTIRERIRRGITPEMAVSCAVDGYGKLRRADERELCLKGVPNG